MSGGRYEVLRFAGLLREQIADLPRRDDGALDATEFYFALTRALNRFMDGELPYDETKSAKAVLKQAHEDPAPTGEKVI